MKKAKVIKTIQTLEDEFSLDELFDKLSEMDDDEYEFTEEEIAEFERREQRKLRGEGKSYTWDEAYKIITSKKGEREFINFN